MNTFSATGRVVSDAELRTAGTGKVCSVRLAFDFGHGDKRGSLFANASIWRGSEQFAPRLAKGAEVHVSGELSTREYTTRDGAKAQAIDLAVDRVGRIRAPQGAAAETTARVANGPSLRLVEDEIPF